MNKKGEKMQKKDELEAFRVEYGAYLTEAEALQAQIDEVKRKISGIPSIPELKKRLEEAEKAYKEAKERYEAELERVRQKEAYYAGLIRER